MTDLRGLPDDDSGFHAIGQLPMHGLRRPVRVALDGEWEFQLVADATAGIGDGWSSVTVPGLWTMREASDPPQYLNVRMPFDETPPTVPADNPVGVYRRRFEAPDPDAGRVVLHVGAAEGLLRVFVNDRLIGTANDSHLAAEFDITDVISPGENTLMLAVTKWSALSYLEDQDHWWHSGLSRSVALMTVPQIRISDLSAVADFDPETGEGRLDLLVSTDGHSDPAAPEHQVRIRVVGVESTESITALSHHATINTTESAVKLDRSVRPEPLIPPDIMEFFSDIPSGAPIPSEWAEAADAMKQMYMVPKAPAGSAGFTLTELPVAPWSAERPNLEELVVELLDADGIVIDATTVRIGFRRIEVVGRDLRVNGRRILVQGVNRHDSHPRTGRVLTRDDMLEELSQLKRFNFNAIRTSHYPNDPIFLDLCDELGFYVVDEANIEAHAFMDAVSGDPRYLPAFTERVSRMVLRDRNHPSVIVWSLGNETGYGANHDAVAAWARRFDPTRPVMYEGAVSKDWHGGHGASDIACPMYPTPRSLISYSSDPRSDRPLILSEYAYSQGNSTGGLDRYWELFETLPGVQGGFIWEYLDHAIDIDGDGRYRSGGDFGDHANDGDLMLNGIAFADRTPKPAMFEAREIFTPARVVSSFEEVREGALRVLNRQTFADWAAFTFELRVDAEDGDRVSAPIEVNVDAGRTAEIALPSAVRAALSADDVVGLTLTVSTRHDSPWSSAGVVIAEQQVAKPVTSVVMRSTDQAPLALDDGGDIVHPLLRRAPRLSLWRALTDNDTSTPLDQRFVRSGFFALSVADVVVEHGDRAITITTRYTAAFGDPVTHRRTVSMAGADEYVFAEEVTLPEGTTDGLRVGVEFELADGFDRAEWLGLGPWENYPDRRSSSRRGAWQSAIDDLAVRYMPPQENGGRGDVTRLALSGDIGTVSVVSETPMQMNVGRYTTEELEAAPHWWALAPSAATVVHLDVAHRGVGTGVLGPDTAPEFRLDGGSYSWRWRLSLAVSE